MKLILSAFLVIACSYLGFAIAKNIKQKKKFWEDMIRLCEMLSSNISFGQKKLNEIFYEYKTLCGESCNKVLQNVIDNRDENLDFKLSEDFLRVDEKKLLLEFFNKIGELDVYNELAKIDNYKLRFLKIYEDYCEKSKKFSPLIVKLSIIFGIMICIVFI